MKDEEYYKRINNIYSLLVKAYMDKYILESIEHFKKEKQDKQEKNSFFYNNTVFTLIHICELAKADLALELWKMYYDNKAQANTIKQLKNYLNSEYKLRLKIVETQNIKDARKLVVDARHGFIAHNFMDSENVKVNIKDLLNALEDIRSTFNQMCLQEVDSRVQPLTDEMIYKLSYCAKTGLDLPLILMT